MSTLSTAPEGAVGPDAPPSPDLPVWRRQPLLWVALAVLVAGALSVVAGPLVGVGAVLVVPVAVVLLRRPLLALALPIVAAPVGLTPLPVGGLQVIHLATLTAIGGTVLAVVTGKLRFRPPAIMALGGCFVAAMLAATVVAANPLGGLKVSANYLFGVSLSVCVAIVVRSSAASLQWLLRGWTAASIVLIAPALPSALQSREEFAGSLVAGRVQGAFNQPNDFGEFSMLSAVVAGALLAGASRRGDKLLAGAGVLVGVAGVAVSFSRGSWIGGLVALVAVAVLSPRTRLAVGGIFGIIPVALLVGAALAAPPFPTLVERFASLVTGASNPADDRPILYAQAWHVFITHPVLGVGPGGFLATSYQPGSLLIRRTYLHGHSVILTVAAEVGVVGVLALLAFTVALAVSVLRARSVLLARGLQGVNARLAILAAGLVGLAVHGLFDVVYTNPLLIPLAWFLAGLVAGESTRATDQVPRPGLVDRQVVA